MKQRLTALFLIIGLAVLLMGLNALTYVKKEKEADSELRPNRSTFNAGSTGTQAFFTLLNETGRKAIRWQDTPEGLAAVRNKPNVFVMIGSFRREVTKAESESLLRWVSQGGRLVVIDRDPAKELCTTTANWKITFSTDPAMELLSVDPSDQKQMTSQTAAARPVQPTILTANVNAVQPSRFAGWINFERYEGYETAGYEPRTAPPLSTRLAADNNAANTMPTSPASIELMDTGEEVYEPTESAPVVHVAGNQKNLLVDVPYGSGRVVYLADPYIVSNGGIGIVDNSQMALNLVDTSDGTIAFDEYHQGYGSNANRMYQYFEGTPVIAIFVQCAILLGLIFYSQSRRFARPLPEKEPDRLSKLEYVTAMAELQQRTRAYDVAMENIYTDFRRRVTRALGLDNLTATRYEVAERIAERMSTDAYAIGDLMAKCEAIIHGEPTSKAETLELIRRLREIQGVLGIKRDPKGKMGR